jgi:branched-subunit amino acid aminotransferase/4-amino-4-deoxychorismate lyase
MTGSAGSGAAETRRRTRAGRDEASQDRVLVWLGGRILDAAAASVPVEDRGFLLGDGLFETMRARGGAVFRLGEHLARLRSGASRIGLAAPGGVERAVADVVEAAGRAAHGPATVAPPGVERAVAEVVAAAGRAVPDLAVRLTLTRGPGGPGLEPGRDAEPTLAVSARPLRIASGRRDAGLSLRTSTHRLSSRSITAGLKALGYLPNLLARAQARAAGADDALLLDDRGLVSEASAANLFWLTPGGTLRTPAASCPILPGITRAAVLEIASPRSLAVEEGEWRPEELAAAAEAFATSSLRGVVPVTALDGLPIGAGGPGPRTLELAAAYEELVRRETS